MYSYRHLAWHHYYARQYDQAVEAAREAVNLDPTGWNGRYELLRSYGMQGKYDLAIMEAERALPLAKGSARVAAARCYVYAASGRTEEARQFLTDLLAKAQSQCSCPCPTTIECSRGSGLRPAGPARRSRVARRLSPCTRASCAG